MNKVESVILCEGFYDRAFWAGWLLYVGCTDPGVGGGGRRLRILDPFGRAVVGGQHAYLSKSGKFIRVVPCEGKDNITRKARLRLLERVTHPLDRLLVSVDSDLNADGTAAATSPLSFQAVHGMVMQIDPSATSGPNELKITGGDITVSLIKWETGDLAITSLPNQQTLERLVCGAINEAYPARAKVLQEWLAARPDPPKENPKSFSWSQMAGWYPDRGCEGFLSTLWSDQSIAQALEKRLQVSGAWSVVQALVT